MFHRAICQSGGLLFPGAINENPAQTSFDLGKKLNCTVGNSTELVKCLRIVSAEHIIKASYADPFVISIEPPSENSKQDTILPGHPLTLLQNGALNNVPVIFGVNSGEGLTFSLSKFHKINTWQLQLTILSIKFFLIVPDFILDSNSTDFVNDNFNEFIGHELMLDLTAVDPDAMMDDVHTFYLGDRSVSRETQGNFTNIFTGYNKMRQNSLSYFVYVRGSILFQIVISFIQPPSQPTPRAGVMDAGKKSFCTTLIGKFP